MAFVDISKIYLSFVYVKSLPLFLSVIIAFSGFGGAVRADCTHEESSIICDQTVLSTGLKAEDEVLFIRLDQGSYISTFNQESYGVQAMDSQINMVLDRASILNTIGSYADGVHIEGSHRAGGQNSLEFYDESILSTFGSQASGISIEDARARILLDESILQTGGDGASGISAANSDLLLTLDQGSSIETSGNNSSGLSATNSAVEAIITGASRIRARGQDARGIEGAHQIRIDAGSSVSSDTGTALVGLEAPVTINETDAAGLVTSYTINPNDSFWIGGTLSGGTLSGGRGIALDAGAGDDQITIDGTTASISGLVTGGAGDDRLILEGNGIISDQYIEFEQVELANGAEWVLESGQTIDYARTLLMDSELQIHGDWEGDIILDDAGAGLTGTGQLHGTLINRAGVFAFRPDESPSEQTSLTFAGGFQQQEGAVLIIQTGASPSDLLTFSGTAELGGILRVESADSLTIGSIYPLILAEGGISGAFDVIEKPGRFLEFIPSISDEGTLYQVLLSRQPLADSLNGRSTQTTYMANQLDQILTQNPDSLGDVNQALENMSDTDINDYLETQSGIIALEATASAPVMMAATNDIVSGRLARTASLTQVASDGQNSSPESGFATGDVFISFMRLSWWIEGTYGLGSQDSSPDARGYEYNLYGTVSGVETPDLIPNTLSGLFVSWSSSENTVDPDETGARDSGQTHLYQLGAYSRYFGHPALEVSGTFSMAYMDIETTRSTITGTALGQTRGLSALMTGELSSPAQWEITNNWQLGTFIGFETDYTRVDPYTETGAGSSNLAIEQEALSGFKSLIGLMLSEHQDRDSGGAYEARFDLKIALVQNILSDPSQAQVNFLAAPDVIYTTQGAEPDQQALKVGFDLGFDLMESMGSSQISVDPATEPQAYIGYDGQFSQNAEDHRFTGGIKLTW